MKKNYLCFKKSQWFFEREIKQNPKTPKTAIKIKKKVFFGKTPFQEIKIFDTEPFERMLVLDDLIQLTQKHEFIYHEMIVHPAMSSHPNPKKVLIIGGGDGGALREVLRHPVEKVILDDIDREVIEVSKKYLSFVSKGAFEDKRVKIFYEDAIKFIKKFKNFFDVIIVDATDPTPRDMAMGLSHQKFFQDTFSVLKEDGIISIQSGNFTDYFFKISVRNLKRVFPFVKIFRAYIPCFPEEEHSFTLGSKKIDLNKVTYQEIKKRFKKRRIKTKYYTPEIHLASSVIPNTWKV